MKEVYYSNGLGTANHTPTNVNVSYADSILHRDKVLNFLHAVYRTVGAKHLTDGYFSARNQV